MTVRPTIVEVNYLSPSERHLWWGGLRRARQGSTPVRTDLLPD
ncbi:hypothetical protein STRTUCAR8_09446 [Streptomyces turgidiscabies Car8]|uniref:Uncharacterized protein n=1 Tax=Streptomyces turgidiscabies (strain Car8) TaxID=698760 RepID=L7EZI1_STRT8|nr:hypothetical protein STRTUCAR8_09446 [Streptomyces turgidiscabies Car8]